ncbi:MAG: hypothetical protein KME15_06800 [Drouetiella hepatica Uher 2000/2452]|jgi:hypothetical protein|uniref:Uncharacterized protein n=1 Tax=Drouetiella hepatica Uher 2000/2452 TaxID=904376 RepID=A0A951Q9A8_9CYAN|nr:hypothetical protein [Drouetiella hepatica Uher 2000/2452]
MQPDLETLRITPSELEHLTGLEISDTFMGRVYRPSALKDPKRLRSLLLTEILAFGIILIFCLPMGLVIAQGLNLLTEDGSRTLLFLGVNFAIAIALFIGWNLYMRIQGKPLKSLAHLLDEVDKHNEIIQAVHIIDQLSSVQRSTLTTPRLELIDRNEIFTALSATRESLISALMTERILRKHHQFVARRHELFTHIETHLATLQNLQINHQANEYGQLLNEALKIGMSVRQEIDRWENR